MGENMSYNIEGKKINETIKTKNLDQQTIDAIVRFGQVAKYRCRSNVAYIGFLRCVFDGIGEIKTEERKNEDGSTYTHFEVVKINESYDAHAVIKEHTQIKSNRQTTLLEAN